MGGYNPIQYDLFKDKSAIVTGGASGLGLATATRFAEHGAYVTMADLDQERGEKEARQLSSRGFKVSFVQCDVTDWSSQVSAFKHAVNFSPHKTLDIAALFAGVAGPDDNIFDFVHNQQPPASLSQDPVRPPTRTLDVNLTGEYLSAVLALHYFRLKPEQQTGDAKEASKSLILVASLAGYIDYNGSSQYAMSKYGIRGLFRNLRKRINDPSLNVRCNSINPGYTKTEMTEDIWGKDMLWASVESVVDAVCLCAVDESVRGRAFCTVPDGFFDLDEDYDKGYAGSRLTELMTSSGYAGRGYC